MRDKIDPLKPKRGYEWICVIWIAGICVFLIIQTLIDGQFTLGEPDGVLIKANEKPLIYWSGIAFPSLVFVGMITLLIRSEVLHRDQLNTYQQIKEEEKAQNK